MTAYTIQGERILTHPGQPAAQVYDVRTLPERVDDDLAVLRADMAIQRALLVDLVETVDMLCQIVADGDIYDGHQRQTLMAGVLELITDHGDR